MPTFVRARTNQLCIGNCLEDQPCKRCPWRGPRFVNFGKTCQIGIRPANVFAFTEYGHTDVFIHKTEDSNINRLFAGIGESMHGEIAYIGKLHYSTT